MEEIELEFGSKASVGLVNKTGWLKHIPGRNRIMGKYVTNIVRNVWPN